MSEVVLVTGAAGFIGFHLAQRLLRDGRTVVGIDNLNDYYDPSLKQARLDLLLGQLGFSFHRADLADLSTLEEVFAEHQPRTVVNLAAQAGVRYSLDQPRAYAESNLVGFLNLLECCRNGAVDHLVYASSSSVYGLNTKVPFSVEDNVDHPISLYAATKKANELMAHTYSHLFGIPTTGLRFFTVYGPWGRPDMATFKFTEAILAGRPIDVYNHGQMQRDFTYIDDIVEGIVRTMERVPLPNPHWDHSDPSTSSAPYRIYNIGNHEPVGLLDFIKTLEDCLGKKATFNMLPMQPGDVVCTYADTDALRRDVGFAPSTPLADGLQKFVDWYKAYYRVDQTA
ncbi:MAG: NAD-dependent epimerase [Fimbriimonadaceae bacterium]|nr:NAD-dependent epimerase [Fimbriimonadaceae bacterium]